VPTEQCAAFIRSAQQRVEDISGWYVITESLSAVIQQQQCGSYNAEAGTFLVSADVSVQQACAQTSLEPVAVAFKTMSVPDLLAMLPEPGPKAEVHLGAEVQGYEQPARGAREGGSGGQVQDVDDALNVQSIFVEPNLDGPLPTGETSVTMGEEQDYAKLAREVAMSEAAETNREDELRQNAADATAYLAEVEERRQEFEDALALERDRLATATEAAQTALEAERNRRIAAAAAPIREKANRDFAQISPHMRQDMPPAARSLLLAFLRQYQSAAVEIDGERFPVDLAAVRTARAYLGERISLTEPNSIGLVFAELPPGVFMMGCTEGQGVTCEDGETAHSVQLRQMVAVATTEVTQDQWTAVMGDGPSASSSCGPTCPVENVSWQDATEFANRLSKLEGLDECYVFEEGVVGWPSGLECTGYRLLTEAEWEYAARAGEDHAYSGSDEAEDVAWVSSNSEGQPQPVGTRKANAWRIHDMSGNVWEWVWDGYASFSAAPTVDPLGPEGNSDRVNRGGSWYLSADQACVSRRFSYYTGYRAHDVGLRIGRTVK
jgi:formylglycine-generating enzyme required for sulfatase activity